MAIFGMISRRELQFQQNSAHQDSDATEIFAASRTSCQPLVTHRWGPNPFAYCLVRDPHSYRSAPFVGQPVSFFRHCAKICRNFLIALAVTARTVNLLAIEIITKGTKTCLRKLGSSQQQQQSAWLAAWKQTFSAAQLAQQLVQLQQTRLAQTKPQQHLLAQLLACFATTQASAARLAKTFRAVAARFTNMNSRRGNTSAAVLRSKDLIHV